MNKKIFKDKLVELSSQYSKTNDYFWLESMEKIFQDYLKQNTADIEMSIEYAIFLAEYLHGENEAIQHLENLLAHKIDIRALLVLVMIRDFSCGFLGTNLIDLLSAIKPDSNEMMSMVEYAKARIYSNENKEMQEECLIRSVSLWNKHVHNNEELAKIYFNKGDLQQGCNLIKQALGNINCIFPEVWPYIETDFKIIGVNEYLEEFIKGTKMSYSHLKRMGELYLQYNPKDQTK